MTIFQIITDEKQNHGYVPQAQASAPQAEAAGELDKRRTYYEVSVVSDDRYSATKASTFAAVQDEERARAAAIAYVHLMRKGRAVVWKRNNSKRDYVDGYVYCR